AIFTVNYRRLLRLQGEVKFKLGADRVEKLDGWPVLELARRLTLALALGLDLTLIGQLPPDLPITVPYAGGAFVNASETRPGAQRAFGVVEAASAQIAEGEM